MHRSPSRGAFRLRSMHPAGWYLIASSSSSRTRHPCGRQASSPPAQVAGWARSVLGDGESELPQRRYRMRSQAMNSCFSEEWRRGE